MRAQFKSITMNFEQKNPVLVLLRYLFYKYQSLYHSANQLSSFVDCVANPLNCFTIDFQKELVPHFLCMFRFLIWKKVSNSV